MQGHNETSKHTAKLKQINKKGRKKFPGFLTTQGGRSRALTTSKENK
jgi:hypothetical protein